jgi:hypothetical protein
MKNTTITLNVDFIGGLAPLSQAEEIALNEYFKNKKIKYEPKKNIKRANNIGRKLEKA